MGQSPPRSEHSNMDSSLTSILSSSSSSLQTELTASDQFWKKYKRGRESVSIWKILKKMILRKGGRNSQIKNLSKHNNTNSQTYETNKEEAIQEFYNQLHQQYSYKNKIIEEVSLNEYYDVILVNDFQQKYPHINDYN